MSKLLLTLYLLLNAALLLKAQEATPASPDEPLSVNEKGNASYLANQMRKGEASAFEEASRLKPGLAIPLLAMFATDRFGDPAKRDAAQAALRSVKGHGEYLRKRLLFFSAQKTTSAQFERIKAFRTLGVIRTNESVNTIAPFLFDDTMPEIEDNDVGLEPNRFLAADALAEMHLPDAPVTKTPHYFQEEDIEKWRVWWLANKHKF